MESVALIGLRVLGGRFKDTSRGESHMQGGGGLVAHIV